MKDHSQYIKFKHDHIEYRFTYVSSPDGPGKKAVYIPAYDMYFSAPDDAAKIEQRATNMVQSFYKFWIEHEGFKQYILKIHKLGFRAEKHDWIIQQLLNKAPLKGSAKFEPTESFTPESFEDAELEVVEGKFEMAAA